LSSVLIPTLAWTAGPIGGATSLEASRVRIGLEVGLVSFVELPPAALATLETEAGAILSPSGTDLRFSSRAPGDEIGPREVPLILMNGEHPVRGGGGAVLGGVERRARLPSAWVYVPAVERVIGTTRSPRSMDLAAQRALGLALGRVVAHELVHAMAPARAHVATGFMGAEWNRDSLLGGRPCLDAASAAAWRGGVRRWLSNESDTRRVARRRSSPPEPSGIRARQSFLYGTPGDGPR